LELKPTSLGFLVYAVMTVYLVVAAAYLARLRRLAEGLYAFAFVLAVGAFGLRWYEVNHVPLQNLFEVCLCLGMLIWPITLFCRRFLGVGGEAGDAIIGFAILFPAGFIFKAEMQHLPPALQSPLFIPHVASYMLAYVIMAKAAVQAMAALAGSFLPEPDEFLDDRVLRATAPSFAAPNACLAWEEGAYRVTVLGFPLLTLGLLLGAVWGKIAWGDYWNWDPKELWSLISWLVFLGYFHFRYMYGKRFPRINASLVLAGLVAIILTLLWVNLANLFKGGMHSYAS